MRFLVTGGAGFIGSSLCKKLVANNNEIIVFDNFSTVSGKNLDSIKNNITIIKGDCLNRSELSSALNDVDVVFHLAANPEVRTELSNSINCFNQNVKATFEVCEAIKDSSVHTFVFASTSAIYGQLETMPMTLSLGENLPISFYGASKLASESLVSAYSHNYNKKTIIVRLANVVGSHSNHGVTYDFVNKLRNDPKRLIVMGNGKQKKSYIYIDDVISAIEIILNKASSKLNIFNIGSADQITVDEIAQIVIKTMKLDASIEHHNTTNNGAGWLGDLTNVLLDISKTLELGWSPKYSSKEAIELTAKKTISQNN